MKKISVMAFALIAICLISGGYAIYSSYDTPAVIDDNNPDTSVSDHPDVDVSSKEINSDEKSIGEKNSYNRYNILETSSSYSQIPQESVSKAIEYILSPNPDLVIYIQKGEDFTDKYIPCAECGKFLCLGNVTKMLPEGLICHAHEDMSITEGYKIEYPWILSYEEVLYTAEHGYVPVEVDNRIADYLKNQNQQFPEDVDADNTVVMPSHKDQQIHVGIIDTENLIVIPSDQLPLIANGPDNVNEPDYVNPESNEEIYDSTP